MFTPSTPYLLTSLNLPRPFRRGNVPIRWITARRIPYAAVFFRPADWPRPADPARRGTSMSPARARSEVTAVVLGGDLFFLQASLSPIRATMAATRHDPGHDVEDRAGGVGEVEADEMGDRADVAPLGLRDLDASRPPVGRHTL